MEPLVPLVPLELSESQVPLELQVFQERRAPPESRAVMVLQAQQVSSV